VWAGLELHMLQPARTRWQNLSDEDRVVVEYAFRDAIQRPYRVGDYTLKFFRLKCIGEILQLHEFRFGFVTFSLVTSSTSMFLCDFVLDSSASLAAE
jgi:hypothetical protein